MKKLNRKCNGEKFKIEYLGAYEFFCYRVSKTFKKNCRSLPCLQYNYPGIIIVYYLGHNWNVKWALDTRQQECLDIGISL